MKGSVHLIWALALWAPYFSCGIGGRGSSQLNVTFIGIGSYRFSTAVPAMEAAVSLINNAYQGDLHVKLVTIFPASLYACDLFGDNIANYAASFYYSKANREDNGVKVFLGPSCVPELTNIAPLMTQLNTLYASFIGTDALYSNKSQYPTTITSSPIHHTVLLQCFRKILLYFGWRNIFIICDESTGGTYYRAICGNFRKPGALGAVQVSSYNFNTKQPPVEYDIILHAAAKSARVILLGTNVQTVRQFMIHAWRMNMTSSEYAYICTTPYIATDFPELQWRVGDSDDLAAGAAFSQLLLLNFDNDRALDTLSLATQSLIKERSSTVYNYTYAPHERVLNESWSDGGADLRDAKVFAKRFFNRTFELPTGSIYMNENGDRQPDLFVRQLNPETGILEPVLFYVASSKTLHNVSSFHWRGGQAPSGLLSRLPGSDAPPIGTIIGPLAVLLLLTAMVAIYVHRYLTGEAALQDRWWLIEGESVIPRAISTKSFQSGRSRKNSDQE
ncbi:hypothetical protein BV898_11203 [Hypsibius exemplaris]|uniref:Receptor ligand binding region domain-containing protein n=1 Tax=Hypsibius exemplaris TaxID=2072580 RepID=A0A1W0WHA4_HYPEX|nr:hypothetical protein BV898_11203 [Hypsibius exemplaris]